MSFWDNVKKFAQPYADDDYDDYDEDDDYLDDYDEPAEPARRSPRRTPAAAPVNEPARNDYGFTPAPAAPVAAPVAPVAPAAPAAAPVAPMNTARPAATGFNGSVLNMNTNNNNVIKQEVVLFRPTSFNDTSKAADDLRHRKAVIVNMENVDKAMARRVVDFLSGCVYALDGTVKKIAQSAYLFCPHNMDVVGDLENIQAEVESYM